MSLRSDMRRYINDVALEHGRKAGHPPGVFDLHCSTCRRMLMNTLKVTAEENKIPLLQFMKDALTLKTTPEAVKDTIKELIEHGAWERGLRWHGITV